MTAEGTVGAPTCCMQQTVCSNDMQFQCAAKYAVYDTALYYCLYAAYRAFGMCCFCCCKLKMYSIAAVDSLLKIKTTQPKYITV
jgi:hypothetical protein